MQVSILQRQNLALQTSLSCKKRELKDVQHELEQSTSRLRIRETAISVMDRQWMELEQQVARVLAQLNEPVPLPEVASSVLQQLVAPAPLAPGDLEEQLSARCTRMRDARKLVRGAGAAGRARRGATGRWRPGAYLNGGRCRGDAAPSRARRVGARARARKGPARARSDGRARPEGATRAEPDGDRQGHQRAQPGATAGEPGDGGGARGTAGLRERRRVEFGSGSRRCDEERRGRRRGRGCACRASRGAGRQQTPGSPRPFERTASTSHPALRVVSRPTTPVPSASRRSSASASCKIRKRRWRRSARVSTRRARA